MTKLNLEELNEADIQHITEQLQKGFTSGNLNTEEHRGFWEIKFEKWVD